MRRVTYWGGPLDGEVTNWRGHEIRMPVHSFAGYASRAADVPQGSIPILRFFAMQDADGRWFYVLTP